MDVDSEAKKVIWSLQNNVRSEEERNVFKPTGKKPKSNTLKYVLVVLTGLLAISFVMAQFQKTAVDVCIVSDFCINSEQDALLYVLYVFINVVLVVFGIYFAYRIGKYLAGRLM
ncbi:hypothetical protein NHF50_03110 [Flavobacterium sp. NRK F10]|uniref:Uncharacterized protein n=1 Tax=Flavobacterium sediminis TaxID=2201181 RepID=A0A2U8QSP0_9FLAO|nr:MULTISPECIES: hypothetical protein [Flavobacterium]AWM12896.1 hypothetical protein DI487_02770 [Flavobacterium sediminis]MCO6174024.1 hypothetical protein [Flavobacterium sp. NRK F10]